MKLFIVNGMEELIAGAIAALGVTSLIQISPIKITPWTWLGRKIGRALNGEVLDELGQLKGRMDRIETQAEVQNMETARIRILRFGDECRRGIKHGEEHFNQVLDDIDRYEKYCAGHPDFKNAKAVLTVERIKACYADRLEKGDFL